MARETKTIQCYPDDDEINSVCAVQASFGWELIGNQRCNEEKTYGDYVRTSTFNKLTFSREKTSPWYGEVVELETQYTELMDSEPECYACRPDTQWRFWGVMGLAFAVLSGLLLFGIGVLFLFFIPLALFVIGALLLTVYIVKTAHYKRDYAEYLSRLQTWKSDTGAKAETIRAKAEAIVNG